MATLQSVITARKKDLRALRALLRSTDSAVEKTERKIKTLLSRKRKVPEVIDLDNINLLARDIDTKLNSFIDGLAAAGKNWYNL